MTSLFNLFEFKKYINQYPNSRFLKLFQNFNNQSTQALSDR